MLTRWYHSELRNALTGLNTLSNITTRRLDNTYYSVLEKLSMLQNTISSLKELADLARNLDAEFESEAEVVRSDISAQLDSFSDFQEQESRIADLKKRVEVGRGTVKGLGDRVDIVKERVAGWERAERDWQDKTRKRLKILWILVTICGAIFIALLVFQYTPGNPEAYKGHNSTGLNATGLLGKIPDMESVKDESGIFGETPDGDTSKNKTWGPTEKPDEFLEGLRPTDRTVETEEDPRLRVFDEL